MGALDPIKNAYFFVEDAYYSVLDKIDSVVPIYKLIDPIDKLFPSFILFVLILFGVIGFFAFGGISFGTQNVNASFVFSDSVGAPVKDLTVLFRYGEEGFSKKTDSNGTILLQVPIDSNISVSVNKTGFRPFNGSFLASSSKQFKVLLSAISSNKKSLAFFDDATNQSLVGKTVSVSFICADASIAAPSVQTTVSGELKDLVVPNNCGALSATASVSGYSSLTKALTADRTSFRLQLDESLQAKGSLRVVVKDDQSHPVGGILIQLFKSVGDSRVDQGDSDSVGTMLFASLKPGSYYVRASDSTAAFESKNSLDVVVEPNQTASLNLVLSRTAPVNQRKLLLKVLDNNGNAPLSSASANFLLAGKPLFENVSANAQGLILQPVADADRNVYIAIVSAPNYVTNVVSPVRSIATGDANATTVKLLKITSTNTAKATVRVLDEQSHAVEGALVQMVYERLSGLVLADAITGSDGNALFESLPPAFYHAKAFHSLDGVDSDGISVSKQLFGGANETFSINLVLRDGNVLITVRDSNTSTIAGAKVIAFDSVNAGALLGEKLTNAQGKVSFNFKVDKKPYFKIYHLDHATFTTQPVTLQANYTTLLNATLTPLADLGSFDLQLVSINNLSSPSSQTITPGNYKANFVLTIPNGSNVDGVIAHVRAGADSILTSGAPDLNIFIESANAIAPAVLSSNFNPLDPYSNNDSANNHAKQVNIAFGLLEPGKYPFSANFSISRGTTKDVELHFQAKSDSPPSSVGPFNRVFSVGGQVCPCQSITFTDAQLTGGVLTQPIPLSPNNSPAVPLVKNGDYVLDFIVRNNSAQSISNATLDANSDTSSALDGIPLSQNLGLLNAGESVNSSISFKPLKEPINSLKLTLSLHSTPQLSPNSVDYLFSTTAEKTMQLVLFRSSLTVDIPTSDFRVIVKDSANRAISGANVTLSVFTPGNSSPAVLGIQPTDSNGMILFSLSGYSSGSIVRILAHKTGYLDVQRDLNVLAFPVSVPSNAFSCLQWTDLSGNPINSFNLEREFNGDFLVKTDHCIAPVWVQMESEHSILDGSVSAVAFPLPADGGRKQLKVHTGSILLGEFYVRLKAGYDGSNFSTVKEVPLYVHRSNPINPLIDHRDAFFSLSKTSFDLFGTGSDDGVTSIQNQYDPLAQPNPALSIALLNSNGSATYQGKLQVSYAGQPANTTQFQWKVVAVYEGEALLIANDNPLPSNATTFDPCAEGIKGTNGGVSFCSSRGYIVPYAFDIPGDLNRIQLIAFRHDDMLTVKVDGTQAFESKPNCNDVQDGDCDLLTNSGKCFSHTNGAEDLTSNFLPQKTSYQLDLKVCQSGGPTAENEALFRVTFFNSDSLVKDNVTVNEGVNDLHTIQSNNPPAGFNSKSYDFLNSKIWVVKPVFKEYRVFSDNPNVRVFFRDATTPEKSSTTNLDDLIVADYTPTSQPIVNRSIPFSISSRGFQGSEYVVLDVISAVGTSIGLPTLGEEKFHVKVSNLGANECVGFDAAGIKRGFSGADALPKIKLSWDGSKISENDCNANNSSAYYCDSTQFSLSLLKRLKQIDENLDAENYAVAEQLKRFDALLMQDGYSADFQRDFSNYATTHAFFDTTTDAWFNGVNGFHRIFSDTTTFQFDSGGSNQLSSPGKYAVSIDIKYANASQPRFFDGATVNTSFVVYLTKLSDPTTPSVFYRLPFDGQIGFNDSVGQFQRKDYGMLYSGSDTVQINSSLLSSVETAPSNTGDDCGGRTGIPCTGKKLDVQTTNSLSEPNRLLFANQTHRGSLLSVKPNAVGTGMQLMFSPNYATPVWLGAVANASGLAWSMYALRDNSQNLVSGFHNYWTGIASDMGSGLDCRDFSNNLLPFHQLDQSPDSSSTACGDRTAGFSWSGGRDGQKLFLESVFYNPINSNYTLFNGCTSSSVLLGPTQSAVNQPILLNRSNEFDLASISTLFDLAKSGVVCVSNNDQNAEFFWDEKALHNQLAADESAILQNNYSLDLTCQP